MLERVRIVDVGGGRGDCRGNWKFGTGLRENCEEGSCAWGGGDSGCRRK